MVALGARITGRGFGVGFSRTEPQSITLHPGFHATSDNSSALSRPHPWIALAESQAERLQKPPMSGPRKTETGECSSSIRWRTRLRELRITPVPTRSLLGKAITTRAASELYSGAAPLYPNSSKTLAAKRHVFNAILVRDVEPLRTIPGH